MDFTGNTLTVFLSPLSFLQFPIPFHTLLWGFSWAESRVATLGEEINENCPPLSIPTLWGGGNHLFLLQATSLQKVSRGAQPAKKKLGLSSCSLYYSEVSEVLGNPLTVSGEASSILYQERGLPRILYQHLQLFGETNKKNWLVNFSYYQADILHIARKKSRFTNFKDERRKQITAF